MPDIKTVINYFIDIDRYVDKKTDICVLGGCVFVLFGLKPSSPDVDILVGRKDYDIVVKASRLLEKKYKFKVDIITDRWLATIQLPKNYMKRAKRYKKYRNKFSNVRLWTLYVYDTIISKINRFEKKDISDIKTLLDKYDVYIQIFEKRIKRFRINKPITFKRNLETFYKLFGSKLKEKKEWWEL